MNWQNDDEDREVIQKFQGRPNDPLRAGEGTRANGFWAALIAWLTPKATQAERLAERYLSAEVARRESAAAEQAARAAEIAARTDHERQAGAKAAIDLLEYAFPDGDRQMIDRLKLAKWLAANPEVADQVAVIQSLQSEFNIKYGTIVEPRVQEVGGEELTADLLAFADTASIAIEPAPSVGPPGAARAGPTGATGPT